MAASETNPEVFPWLKSLPQAPEFHPTLAEFQDPISYIFKIEQEASKYGICKIVPPVPPAPKKSVITNLNKSLTARAVATQSFSGIKSTPTFTTRQQQIGFCPRKPRPVQKPVWQSGEHYTFQEFEAKAKNFERNYLRKCSKKGALSALEIETLFWKASVDTPFSVEYANDMPGSAFAPRKVSWGREAGEGVNLGETAWNMRGVSREKGSLLRFMKEEIPGVTSPMVYIAMVFSWFAWHVEDHDLHSLNYLHLGASKTWYGVPREAAVAVEEVVRVHGYGGEINPLVTFAILGEKTTVMSPEVFISAGIPCCRLVQNAGEFVVTFPRAYHSGFSHGFNCGEAANIATPEWLRVAKDAAIRRASINYPPMVSHFQLLYDLALALCSRVPMSISAKPRSSRLKDKKKGEGETLVKELFVENVIQNNNLLHILGKGSLIVLLPQSSSDISGCSNVRVGSQLRVKPRFSLGLCNPKEEMKAAGSLVSDDIMLNRNQGIKPMKGFYPVKGKFASLLESNKFLSSTGNDGIFSQTSRTLYTDTERGSAVQSVGLSDQRLFSCTTCGILTFSCVAIIQPREPAARYLMSADCSFFNDWIAGCGATRDGFTLAGRDAINSEQNSCPGWMEKSLPNGLYDVPVQSADYQIQMADQNNEVNSNPVTPKDSSALGLLASTYGNSSDSEEDQVEPDATIYADDTILRNCSSERQYQFDNSGQPSLIQCESSATEGPDISLSRLDCRDEVPSQNIHCHADNAHGRTNFKDRSHQPFEYSVDVETDNFASRSSVLDGRFRNPVTVSHITSNCSPVAHDTKKMNFSKAIVPVENTTMPFAPRSDEDSSRMHIFCLEHAVEVEQQLRSIGGVHMLLLCHPDYPKVEAEAKLVAEELGIDYMWNDITFRDATKDDESRIQSALDSEESIPGNGDWAVKLGINLFYSANLSHSPLYSKQMPYNSVIYNAFGRSSPASSPTKFNVYRRRTGKQKKVVAGKWCGRVWMSNQVHPFLVQRDPEEQEQDKSVHAWEIPDDKIERKSERTPKTETTLMTRNSGRKRKMTVESGSTKKVKYMDAEDVVSDGSLEDDYRQQYGRILRSNPPKCIERENVIADDSLKENSHQQRRRFIRGKQVKCIEREDAGSDESLDDNSHLQHRRFLRGKQAKCFEREDEVNYDSLEDDSDQHHVGILRGKQFKCFEGEDAVSYDSLEDDFDQHHGGILRGEQSKYTNGEYVVSDDLPEDDSYPQHRRILRGRQPKYVEGEDAVSDDLLEDNSLQQHRWNLRGKKTKCVEREAVSDDILEDNCLQMHKRVPRGKQVKSMERDDAVSDNSVENNSHRQQRRILRSKQMKQETSPPIKQGASRPIKRGSSRLVKQGTSRLFKQATTVLVKQRAPRQLKQETTRKTKQEILELRNSKRDHSGRQFNTNVEEELEGGPSTRLRKRTPKPKKELETKLKEKKQTGGKKLKNASAVKAPAGYNSTKRMDNEDEHQCDIEGCTMSFGSKQELTLHKRNICPVKGCGKKFFSHKYLVQHRRVHLDDRPLKCPWKGCKMTFKWAWARTEHIRVHTGARPYVCTEAGCGQTFRFVSDFSRHKRKTGHSAKKVRR